MWLSLVFHSLAARCKIRLCAPAGERELCVHESSLSMTQLCQLSPKLCSAGCLLVSYMTLASQSAKKAGFRRESYRKTGLASRAAPPAAPSVHELAGGQSYDLHEKQEDPHVARAGAG